MTQPNPDEAKAKAEADAKAKAEAKAKADAPKRGQVVHFTATDGHTGQKFDGLGVVTFAPTNGGAVVVRPLVDYDVQVDEVEPLVVDED
jgi:hypothetical protein